MPRPRGRPRHADVLTPAEWRIVDAVRHGLGNREIARRRGVSVDAVKFHVANAIAKLGVDDRAGLRRWSGVPKHSRLVAGDRPMTSSLEVTAIGQVSRTVADIAQSEAWYRDLLGLTHLYTFDKLAFFDCGGTRLMLSQVDEPNASESILYLRVADIVAAHKTLEARGAEFLSAPHMIHRHENGSEEWMAFFADPEGRPLAIMAATPPA